MRECKYSPLMFSLVGLGSPLVGVTIRHVFVSPHTLVSLFQIFFFFCDALEKFANGHSRNFEHYEYFRCPGGFNGNFVFRVMAFEVDSEIYVF